MAQIEVTIPQIPPAASVNLIDKIEIDQSGSSASATVSQMRSSLLPITDSDLAPMAAHTVKMNPTGSSVVPQDTASDVGSMALSYVPTGISANFNLQKWLDASGIQTGTPAQALFSNIQDAVDEAKVLGVSMYLSGAWSLTAPINVYDGTSIKGNFNFTSGSTVGNSRLRVANGANCGLVRVNTADQSTLNTTIYMENILLDGNRGNNSSISDGKPLVYLTNTNASTSAGLTMLNVSIQASAADSFQIDGFYRGANVVGLKSYNGVGVGCKINASDGRWVGLDVGNHGGDCVQFTNGGVIVGGIFWFPGTNSYALNYSATTGIVVGTRLQQCDGTALFMTGTTGAGIAKGFLTGIVIDGACHTHAVPAVILDNFVQGVNIDVSVIQSQQSAVSGASAFGINTAANVNKNRWRVNNYSWAAGTFANYAAGSAPGNNDGQINFGLYGPPVNFNATATGAVTLTPGVDSYAQKFTATLSGNVTVTFATSDAASGVTTFAVTAPPNLGGHTFTANGVSMSVGQTLSWTYNGTSFV